MEILKHHLKKHGEAIWNSANGRDSAVVEAVQEDNKGYGNSTTIAFNVVDEETAKQVLLSLCETVASRLRSDGMKAEVVSVTIKDCELQSVSHQTVLKAPTNITSELYFHSCRLFDELWDGAPIRLLGVRTSRVSREESGRQLSLFDHTDYDKLEKMDQAVDEIRKQPIENMAGGHPEGKLPAPEVSAAEGLSQNWKQKETEGTDKQDE